MGIGLSVTCSPWVLTLKRTMRHFHFCFRPPSMRRSLAVNAWTVMPLVGLPWLFSAATYSLKMRA